MLRLVMAAPDPQAASPRVLGVDDFAFRRGRHYGTLLSDIETGAPLDLLGGRDAQPLADWPTAHPGVEIICRDRGGSYAIRGRQDRGTGRGPGRRPVPPVAEPRQGRREVRRRPPRLPGRSPRPGPHWENRARRCRNRNSPAPTGSTPSAPGGTTPWCTGCAPKGGGSARSPATWAGACTPSSGSTAPRRGRSSSTAAGRGPRPSKLDPFKPYLDQHADGARGSIRRLFLEIQALGYDGSYPVVRDYLARKSPAREPLPPAPPTVRDVTNWLCRRPDTLTEDERPRLKAILDRCPELQAASGQVGAFASMITGLTGENLPRWIEAACTAGLPGTASFAKGLEQDLDAITNGLTMNWSSGPFEGRVNLK
jgi:hypothetical protein